MFTPPVFSIVIPLFNKGISIANTLESVLNQDFKNFEIIIVDDGSTDDSLFIVQNILDSRIHIIKQKNQGPAVARNEGVRFSKGTWIIFLDADDKFLPNALSTFHGLINQYPSYSLFVCNFYLKYNGKNKIFFYNFHNGPIRYPYRLWASYKFYIRTGNYAIRKDIVKKYPFNKHLLRYEDSECFFKIMEREKIYSNSTPVMIYDLSYCKASHPCKYIKDDYLGHLNLKTKSFWKYFVLFDLCLQAFSFYPEAKTLYHSEDHNIWYKIIFRLITIYLKAKYKMGEKLHNSYMRLFSKLYSRKNECNSTKIK
jgi:glycosyltransferase involved in cell wall biosynthesis